MRKLALSVSLLAALACGACTCTVEKRAVAEVERSHEIVSKKLLEYVDKDPALKPAEKADWKAIVASDKRNLDALRRALGD